jgi:phage shock protein A
MKKNYLMEIIREEISSYLGENEPMYDSPQTQQREMNILLDQVENLKRLRADLDDQIAQLEATANTFNVNEAAFEITGKNKKTVTSFKDKTTADAFGRENQVKVTPLEEETLNEMPFIGGEKGAELFTAIKTASEKLKDQFPDATAKDISKIILSKKKRPEFAPEVEDALMAQEEKYGADPKYTASLGGPQTERAVAKALGEYEPGQRGRTATEKPAAEPKSKSEPKAKSTPAAKSEKPAAKPTTSTTKPEDKEDAAAMKMAANVKGSALTSGEKYNKLKASLDAKTAELKAMAGSTDMEKRKALTAEKMRIEDAMEKLKQVKM